MVLKEDTEFAGNGVQKASVRQETSVVSGTMRKSVQKLTPKTAPPSEPPTQRGWSASRRKNLRGWSPSGKFSRQPCRDYLKGICTKSLCDDWHPPECKFCTSESCCKFGEKCSFAHRQVEGRPSKKLKKDDDKSAVATLKNVRQLRCVFQYTELPVSLSILRKNTKVLGSIRRVRFTKATQRQANIRESKGEFWDAGREDCLCFE